MSRRVAERSAIGSLRRQTAGALTGALLALASHGAWPAASYYLDADVGDDAWSGRRAEPGGSDGPWRTLRRLTQASLQAGDTVVLRCGSVWREPLQLRGGGRPGAALSVTAAKGCAATQRPEISASVVLERWMAESGGVHFAAAGGEVYQVFVDGRRLEPARFPVFGMALASGALSGGSDPQGRDGLTAPALAEVAGRDLRGARAYVRTQGWLIEEGTAMSAIDGSLRLASALRYPARKGSGFYLTGKRWMLDAGPGWVWSAEEKRLYLRLADGSAPAQHRIEASVHPYGVQLTGGQDVAISGLRVRNAGLDGVRLEGGARVTLRDMEVLSAGRDGVAAADSADVEVRGSLIRASGRDGIALPRSRGGIISGNAVEASGTEGGPRNSLAAINATGSDGLHIEGNRITGVGYIGIRFNRGTRVAHNVVRDTCLVLDDCGAIYSWSGNAPGPLRSEVIGNIVERVLGGREGAPDPWTVAAGIYLDDLTSDVTVDGNTVTGAERAIYLHNAFANRVSKNIVAGSRTAGLYISTDSTDFTKLGKEPNVFNTNTVLSEDRVPHIYFLDRVAADIPAVDDSNISVGGAEGAVRVIHRIRGAFHEVSRQRGFGSGQRYSPGPSPHPVGEAVLLTNDGSGFRSIPCPPKPGRNCAGAVDRLGIPVAWPLRLAPVSSAVIWFQ